MRANYLPQPRLMEKAVDVLIENLGISEASEFWYSLGFGKKDYASLRKRMFGRETVDTLYRKIKKFDDLHK